MPGVKEPLTAEQLSTPGLRAPTNQERVDIMCAYAMALFQLCGPDGTAAQEVREHFSMQSTHASCISSMHRDQFIVPDMRAIVSISLHQATQETHFICCAFLFSYFFRPALQGAWINSNDPCAKLLFTDPQLCAGAGRC
jgi:hypothetical protein